MRSLGDASLSRGEDGPPSPGDKSDPTAKVVTRACGLLGFLRALVVHGFGVGSPLAAVKTLFQNLPRRRIGVPFGKASLPRGNLIARGGSSSEGVQENARGCLGCLCLAGGYHSVLIVSLESGDTSLWPPGFPMGISSARLRCWITFGCSEKPF